MKSLHTHLARRLRRWAQRLSPLLTDRQISELRDYYGNHNAFTGEPLRKTVTVAVDDLRSLLDNGVDWTDDNGPTIRLARAVNATILADTNLRHDPTSER